MWYKNGINENHNMTVKQCFYMILLKFERMFAVIKQFCFSVLHTAILASILHCTNVLKWKWIRVHKTDDVKALEWNSHQESTIWCIGLPLAEESINIRASHSVVLKARLYRVVPISSRDIVTSKFSENVTLKRYSRKEYLRVILLYVVGIFMHLLLVFYYSYRYLLILLNRHLASIKLMIIILHLYGFILS